MPFLPPNQQRQSNEDSEDSAATANMRKKSGEDWSVVPEICSRTDIQTDTRTDTLVKMLLSLIWGWSNDEFTVELTWRMAVKAAFACLYSCSRWVSRRERACT